MRRPWLVGPLFLTLCTTVAIGDTPKVGNTSQKGSVHILPYIVSDTNRTTFVRLANEGPADIDVHCEYRDDNNAVVGFVVQIKKRQAIWFDVTEGGINTPGKSPVRYPEDGDGEGMLVCWAVDEADANQIKWNHIFVQATIVDYQEGTLFEYNSWAFQALPGLDKAPVGTAGKIDLDGICYDACPAYLHGVSGDNPDTPPDGGGTNGGTTNDDPVIVTPCKIDVRQDRNGLSTRLQITTWNAAGTSSTVNNYCRDFWNRVLLPNSTGQFRISADGVNCTPPAVGAGIVGVHYRPGDTARGGTDLAGSGSKNGFIRWDPAGLPY